MGIENVLYDESMEMKKLGFNEKGIGLWIKIENRSPKVYNNKKLNSETNCDTSCTAMSYSHAFRWFSKNYGLKSYIREDIWNDWCVVYITSPDSYVPYGEFRSYYEAKVGCLKKLIEIAKWKISNKG